MRLVSRVVVDRNCRLADRSIVEFSLVNSESLIVSNGLGARAVVLVQLLNVHAETYLSGCRVTEA